MTLQAAFASLFTLLLALSALAEILSGLEDVGDAIGSFLMTLLVGALTLWLWDGLAVRLDDDGLEVRRPIRRRRILWSEVVDVEVADAPFLLNSFGFENPVLRLQDGSSIALWRLAGYAISTFGRSTQLQRHVAEMRLWQRTFGVRQR